MTTIEDIIPKCKYKIQQEQGKDYFMLCYDCNGFEQKGKEINCPHFKKYVKKIEGEKTNANKERE